MKERNPKWQLPRWPVLLLDGWPWRMDVSREATGITASGNRPCGRRKGWDGAEKQSKGFICRLPQSSISFFYWLKFAKSWWERSLSLRGSGVIQLGPWRRQVFTQAHSMRRYRGGWASVKMSENSCPCIKSWGSSTVLSKIWCFPKAKTQIMKS